MIAAQYPYNLQTIAFWWILSSNVLLALSPIEIISALLIVVDQTFKLVHLKLH